MEHSQGGHGSSGRNEPVRRPYFGRRLRELRETYAERAYQSDSEIPPSHTTLSATDLIHCMDQHKGVKISPAAYNEIEQGLNIPRDSARFLDAVAACLRLSPSDHQDLAERMAYDILWAKLHERADDVFPPKRHWIARDD